MPITTTDQPTAAHPIPRVGPLTEGQRRGCLRLLRAIKRPLPYQRVSRRQLARYVLVIASTEKPWSLRHAVLNAAAQAIAPEIFD